MNIKFVHKNFRKHFFLVLRDEIRTAKFCTEVFVMPKHLVTKLNTWTILIHVSTPCDYLYLYNIAELL